MSDLLEAALAYRERGWSVIPISPKTKRPLVKWAKYQDKIATKAQIKKWWKENPNANIAIVTGRLSDLVVIDVDTAKGGSVQEISRHYPTPFVARTGGGGYHLFYTYPDGHDIRNSVGEDGVDVRATGGYVVAAPSIHSSGKRYEWISGDDDAVPNRAPVKWLKNRQRHLEEHDPDDKWITRLMRGVEKGQRNDAKKRLIGYYINHMPQDVVINIMLEWNKKNNPPLKEDIIRNAVPSVTRTKERSEATQREIHEDEGESFMGMTPMNRYMAKYGTKSTEWIIDDWLPDQTIMMMVAAPGSYKTWMLLDLAISVAGGKPFLGHLPVKRTGSVLIFQQEDWGGILAERAAVITSSKYDMAIRDNPKDKKNFKFVCPPDLPIHFHEYGNLHFSDPESMDALEELLIQHRPRLVLLDPLYSAANTEDYMAGSSQKMLRFKGMRRRHGTGFTVVHHTRKEVGKLQRDKNGRLPPMERESGWGSQFLNAWSETNWFLRREDRPHTIQLMRTFKVSAAVPGCVLDFDIETKDAFRYAVNINKSSDVDVLEKPGIMEILEHYGPLRKAQLAELMGVHRSNITRNPLFKGLLKAGEITQGVDGRIYKISDE